MNQDLLLLDKKVRKMNDIINFYEDTGEINENDFYESLCDVLSWCEINIKKINLKSLEENKRDLIEAVKYANNVKKHSIKIYKFEVKTKALYPSKKLFPSKRLFPRKNGIYWNKMEFDENGFVKQYDCYNKYLFNKEISITIKEIVNVLNLELHSNNI